MTTTTYDIAHDDYYDIAHDDYYDIAYDYYDIEHDTTT